MFKSVPKLYGLPLLRTFMCSGASFCGGRKHVPRQAQSTTGYSLEVAVTGQGIPVLLDERTFGLSTCGKSQATGYGDSLQTFQADAPLTHTIR